MKFKASSSMLGGLGLACVICCIGPLFALVTMLAASAAALLAVSETTAMVGLAATLAVVSLAALYWLWRKKSGVAPSCSAAKENKCGCG